MSPIKLGRSGLEKFGWLRILKNSARNCRFTFSLMNVSLKTEKLNSLKLGPFSELRPRLPKWRVPAMQLLSSVAPKLIFGSQPHGAANEDRFRNCKGLLKLYCGAPTTSGRSKPSPA